MKDEKTARQRSSKVKDSNGLKKDVKSNEDALRALQAHFSTQFDVPVTTPPLSVRKGKAREIEAKKEADSGVAFDSCNAALTEAKESPFTAATSERHVKQSQTKRNKTPEMIIFGEGGMSSGSSTSILEDGRAGWKNFMSSKVATRTDKEKEAAALTSAKKKPTLAKRSSTSDDDENDYREEEKQAQSNDRELSELLGTTLFAPGGIATKTTRSNGRHILGHNDTLARLLELSKPSVTGKAQSQGRGLGDAMLKSQDMSKMPANIRHGMRRAELERQEKELQRQKDLGNYHHSIKGLLTKRDGLDLVLGIKERDKAKRKRDKGLGMGIGKFQGGMLKLSEREVDKINRSTNLNRGKKRKI